jgi:hypothetical protein
MILGELIDLETEGLAEREGFSYRRFQQVTVIPTDSDIIQCLRGLQAISQLWVLSAPVSPVNWNSAKIGITGITFRRQREEGQRQREVHLEFILKKSSPH